MLNAFRLIPALQVIFRTEIEFTPESFEQLNAAQREAYERKTGAMQEEVYRVLPLEPTVLERSEERVTVELSIVTESERELLLEAVQFVYRASAPMVAKSPTFSQRLEFLRPRLPPVVIGQSEDNGPASD